MEKRKKHVSDFSTYSINDMKKKNLFCWYKNTQLYVAKTQQYLHNRPKGLQFY